MYMPNQNRMISSLIVLALVLAAMAAAIPSDVAAIGGGGGISITGDVDLLWCQQHVGETVCDVNVADDLDGDGKADVVVTIENDVAGTFTVMAKRGYDGHHLWQQSHTGDKLDTYVVNDLDGDGLQDVLVEWEETDITAGLIAKKGSDGTTVWQESVTGQSAWMKHDTGDLDGDGREDVLLNSRVGHWTNAESSVMAKRGYDGHTMWQESINGLRHWYWGVAQVAGDLDGDGTADALVLERKDNQYTAIAMRGQNGSHLWEEDINAEAGGANISFAQAWAVDDLDGDGKPDVVVDWSQSAGSAYTDVIVVKRGQDGHHLWQQSHAGEDPPEVYWTDTDDLNGDGKRDMVVFVLMGPAGSRTGTVIAKRGYDGDHLWQQDTAAELKSIGNLVVVDDLDGDGIQDVLVGWNKGPWDDTTTTLIAKSGQDGHHLWQQEHRGDYLRVDAYGAGDVDGDGKEDVLVTCSANLGGGSGTANVTAKRGFDGHHLWEQTHPGENAWIYAIPMDDADCDGMTDVLVTWATGPYAHETDYQVIAKKGDDGSHIWEADAKYGQIGKEWDDEDPQEGRFDLNGDGANDVIVVTDDTLCALASTACGVNTASVATATGTGMAAFATSKGYISGLTATAQAALACGPKPDLSFPDGFFSFNITNIVPHGSTVTVTITLPSAVPVGTQYWKCQNGTWVNVTSLLGDDDGDNVLTLTLTDGGLGDADGLANGTIVEPGGPAVVVVETEEAAAPTIEPTIGPTMPDGASTGGPAPARLTAPDLRPKYLSVNPKQVYANQPVTILTNVVNRGNMAGSYMVNLLINGQVEQRTTVSVSAGGTQPVRFTVTKAQPGTYTVAVGGDRARFTVIGAGQEGSVGWGNGLAVGLVTFLLLLVAGLLLLVVRKRFRAG